MFPFALCTNLNFSLRSSGHLLRWQVEVIRVFPMAIFKVESHTKGNRASQCQVLGQEWGQ